MCVPQFAGHKDLFSGYTAVLDSLADFVLIACIVNLCHIDEAAGAPLTVNQCRVDVSVTILQRE